MTINELHIQLDLQSENQIGILKNIAANCCKGYLFVDSSDGYCYLFNKNGNEDDVKKLKNIDNALFYKSKISSIIIPNSVKSIGDWAFGYCKSLTTIIIPDSVERIGDFTFDGCKHLKSIVISDSVESIGDYAFYKCESLTSIAIPDSVKSVGKLAFNNCGSLKSLSFKGKTMMQIKKIRHYPFGIEDESIIRCI